MLWQVFTPVFPHLGKPIQQHTGASSHSTITQSFPKPCFLLLDGYNKAKGTSICAKEEAACDKVWEGASPPLQGKPFCQYGVHFLSYTRRVQVVVSCRQLHASELIMKRLKATVGKIRLVPLQQARKNPFRQVNDILGVTKRRNNTV